MKNASLYTKRWAKRHPEKYKAMRKERRRKYYLRYPEKKKERNFRKHRGITIAQKQQMFTSQNGRCAICGELFLNLQDACIDHNHTTKQIRGLLCRMCNCALGYAKENVITLSRCVEYLNKWNGGYSDIKKTGIVRPSQISLFE